MNSSLGPVRLGIAAKTGQMGTQPFLLLWKPFSIPKLYYILKSGLVRFNKDKIFNGIATSVVFALIFVMIIPLGNFGIPSLASGDINQVADTSGADNLAGSPGDGSLTVQGNDSASMTVQGTMVDASQVTSNGLAAQSSSGIRTIPFLSGPSGVAPQSSSGQTSVKVVSGLIEDQLSAPAPKIASQLSGFEGVDYPADCGCTPPDGSIAVGPSNIVQAVNLDAGIWTKTGSHLVTFPIKSILGTGTDFISDPRVVYDSQSGHYFASILGIRSTGHGYLSLAVSSTTDPTGSWCFVHVGAANVIPDQPRISVSDDKITLVSSDYNRAGTAFTGEEIWWLSKSQMLACTTVPFDHYGPDSTRFHIEPAVYPVSGNSDFWYVQDGAGGATSAEYLHASGAVHGVKFASVFKTPIGLTSSPPGGAQPGTSTKVATNDARILQSSIRGGIMTWTANDRCSPHSCIRWDVVDTTGHTRLQDMDFGITGKDVYFPGVSQDQPTSFGIIFDFSSTSNYPSIAFTGKASSEPYGTVDAPVIAKAGTGDDLTGRHGDFHTVRADPSTGTYYGEAEYNTKAISWNTFISVNSISSRSISLSPTSGHVGATVTVTGKGFAPSSAITIKYSGVIQTIPPTTTDGTGSFSTTFIVPPSTAGAHTVNAKDAAGHSANSVFTVT